MIIFLRHNILKPPFHDYNNLDFQSLIALWKGEISPDIDNCFSSNVLVSEALSLSNPLVYTSESNRTQQTAEMLDFDIKEKLPCLNEIKFNVSDFMSENQYNLYWLSFLRKQLWISFFSDNGHTDSKMMIHNKINSIRDIIEDKKNHDIIFFSHWFFIILAYLSLVKNINIFDIKTEKDIDTIIKDLTPVKYLSGFIIEDRLAISNK